MRTMIFLATLFLLPPNGLGDPEIVGLEAKLAVRVKEYKLSANDLTDAFAKTAHHFQVPIGIEWVKDKDTLRHLNLVWKGETVEAVLRSIVKEYPGYTFRVDDGVVHVFRRDLVKDSHNFLNLKVPDFFEVRQEIGGLANQRLRSVVQNMVSPRNLPAGAGEGGDYATGIDEKALNLKVSGATVREALNRLADASEHKMWIVTFSDSYRLTTTGFYRTETLWHPSPFPDTEQPMWDFLAWDQYLPETMPPRSPG